MDLTNAQWEIVGPLIPEPPRRPDGRGRPWRPARDVLNGILWILRTGAPWHDLPNRYPSYQTCHRRFQQWVRAGVFDAILHALATDLAERGDLNFSECFIDGTFVGAKKGALALAKPSAAKAPRSWQSPMALVFQSQSTYQALRRMRSPWLSRRWLHASQIMAPNGSSVIQPTTATRMMRPWRRRVSPSLRPIGPTGKSRGPKMGGCCAATNAAGRWNAVLPGSNSFVGS